MKLEVHESFFQEKYLGFSSILLRFIIQMLNFFARCQFIDLRIPRAIRRKVFTAFCAACMHSVFTFIC